MLMKHLVISAIATKDKVPVFIELRQLEPETGSLERTINRTLRIKGMSVTDAFVKEALKHGHFVLLLDGYDEIAPQKRDAVGKNIRAFSEEYPNLSLVISSRPDQTLEGWQGFNIFRVAPLTVKQAGELIDKVEYDSDLKQKFVSDLQKGLFAKHESFLSNPLLLSIMLLTYSESANIPGKLNVFYNQAYEALFQRHDALKAGFKRTRKTRLDIQDFAKVFSAFCVLTFDKRKFEFTRTEALEFLAKAKPLCRVEFVNEDYLHDAQEAVCLLVEEGLHFVFSHRSFQEYFTARFISESPASNQRALVQRFSRTYARDNVLGLLYELAPEVVEDYYFLPAVASLRKELGIKKKITRTAFLKYVKRAYSEFKFHGNPNMRDSASATIAGVEGMKILELTRFARDRLSQILEPLKYTSDQQIEAALKQCGDASSGYSIKDKKSNPEPSILSCTGGKPGRLGVRQATAVLT